MVWGNSLCKSVPSLLQSEPGARTNSGALGIEYTQNPTVHSNMRFDGLKKKM